MPGYSAGTELHAKKACAGGIAPADRLGNDIQGFTGVSTAKLAETTTWPPSPPIFRISRADDETHEVEFECEAKGVLTWDRDSRVLGGGEVRPVSLCFPVACAFGNGQTRRIVL